MEEVSVNMFIFNVMEGFRFYGYGISKKQYTKLNKQSFPGLVNAEHYNLGYTYK